MEVAESRKNQLRNNYMLLKKLLLECDNYLRSGNIYDLYYRAVGTQIEEMKRIYNSFPKEERPEWINLDDMDKYLEKMTQVLAEVWENEFE